MESERQPTTESESVRRPAGGAFFRLGLFVLTLQFALFTIPWRPWYPWDLLDPSWNYVLHHAWIERLAFGNEIVWPYGPLGFAYLDFFHPETYACHLAVRAVLAAGLVLGAWWVARSHLRSGIGACLWLSLFAVLFARDLAAMLFTLPALLLVLQAASRSERPRLHALVCVALLALAAMAGLIKFTMLVAGTGIALLLSARGLLERGRWAWALPAYLGSVLLGWLVLGQRLRDLPAFIGSSLELSGGFHAVSSGFHALELVLFLLGSATLLVALGGIAIGRRDLPCTALLAGFAGLLFLAFKGGFVRQDAHAMTASVVLCVLCLLATAVASGAARWLVAASLLISLAAYDASARTHQQQSLVAHLGYRLIEIPDAARAAWRVARGDLSHQHAMYASRVARIRGGTPLPAIAGSVDVYPWNQGLVLANGLPYRPRPVIQSQLAYTPTLVEINAASLRGFDAPDTILFQLDPLDDLHPGLQDGAVWLELLTRYRPDANAGNFVILRRREIPRALRLTELAHFELPFGEAVDASHGVAPVLWAAIDVPLTIAGRLAAFFYRLPRVEMQLRTRDGARERHRVVPGISAAGFLLSPRLGTTGDFAALAAGEIDRLEGDRVESWWLEIAPAALAGWLYRVPEVRLFELELVDPPGSPRSLAAGVIRHDPGPEAAPSARRR